MGIMKAIIEKIGIAFLLTVTAYFVAYIFEVGYLRSSGISWQVAYVTIPSLAVSFIAINFLGFVLGYIILIAIDMFGGAGDSKVQEFIHMKVLEYAMCLVALSFGSFVLTGKVHLLQVLIQALITPILLIVVPLLSNFRSFHGSFQKRLIDSLRIINEWESNVYEMRGIEKSKVVKICYCVLLVTIIASSSAYLAGYYASVMIRPSRAFVLENNRYVVIRDYSGMVIAKEIVEGRIGEKYMYIDSSQNKLIFYPIHINKGLFSKFMMRMQKRVTKLP